MLMKCVKCILSETMLHLKHQNIQKGKIKYNKGG